MKFTMVVRDADGLRPSWEEQEDRADVRNIEAAQRWSEETIEQFNATLRQHERPRKLIYVFPTPLEQQDPSVKARHTWRKMNLYTHSDRLGNYDIMECSICGVTGKRFNLGEAGVKIDSKFRAKKFQTCNPENIE